MVGFSWVLLARCDRDKEMYGFGGIGKNLIEIIDYSVQNEYKTV